MDEILTEDFYFCKSAWLIKDNPTRVFRVDRIYEEDSGHLFFYPMVDNVFVTDKHTDSNGVTHVNCQMDQFVKATYSEINEYITKVYMDIKHTTNFSIYENKPWLKKLYKDMEKTFYEQFIFNNLMDNLKHFEKSDVYHYDERMLLNLLRSYYKCRILKK